MKRSLVLADMLSVHYPASRSARGGVVLLQEAFGVTPYIEDVGGELAEAGWLTVAPHLFHRNGDPVFDYTAIPDVVAQMNRLTADGIFDDIDFALELLADSGIEPRNIGVLGFCMGGAIALVTACRRDVGAAVTFYGSGIRTARFGFPALADEARRLRAPWLGLFGDRDPNIPVDEVTELKDAAAESGKVSEVARYPDAGHGFHCHDRADFHASSAEAGWQRALAWLDLHLAPARR